MSMQTFRTLLSVFLFAIAAICNAAFAENTNLLPKYGSVPKNEVQKVHIVKDDVIAPQVSSGFRQAINGGS